MNFKLIINGDGVRKLDESILVAEVDQWSKLGGDDNYILLEPKIPIEHNIYLQVLHDPKKGFVAETRFLFSSADDFKHYSCILKSVAEVKRLFLDYYRGKLPPVGKWDGDASLVSEDAEEEMVKLYTNVAGVLCYAEFWTNEEEHTLTIHRGAVGDIGTTEFRPIGADDLPMNVQLEKLTYDYIQQGYMTIDDLTELIIQYRCGKTEDNSTLEEKQNELTSLMNECLGWTGNGHCDGGDIGFDTRNTFCYVADKDIAIETIKECLLENNLLKGCTIAYADEEKDEFVVVYPKGATFEL